jgi:hypothetical protein
VTALMSVVCVVRCLYVELILVQTRSSKCGVSERDLEASIMRRLWPTGGYCVVK